MDHFHPLDHGLRKRRRTKAKKRSEAQKEDGSEGKSEEEPRHGREALCDTQSSDDRACRSAVFGGVTKIRPSPILKVKLKLKAPSSTQVMTSLTKLVLAKTRATVVK